MKRSLIFFLTILTLLTLCACSIHKQTAEQRIWNGKWSGEWNITAATGSWEDNQGISDSCHALIDLDKNGSGKLQLDLDNYGPMFNININSATANGLLLSGNCIPNGQEDSRGELHELQAGMSSTGELVIEGSYTDPQDGEGNGFSFTIFLQRGN